MQMIRFALCLSVTLLTGCDGPARSESAAGQTLTAPAAVPAAAAVPNSGSGLPQEGDAYPAARAQLLGDGWRPVRGACEGGGVSDALCTDFPEVQDCSGTGAGQCSMRFARADQCLTLVTVGGPPSRNGSDTRIDWVRPVQGTCANLTDEKAAESKAMNGDGDLAGLSAATEGLCARLEREGVSKTTKVDEFVPYYPAALRSPTRVDGVSLSASQLRDAVRQLSCGAGLSGFGPDVPQTALPLFSSQRHGAAAMAALRGLATDGSPAQREAARGFLDQMQSYLAEASRGNG